MGGGKGEGGGDGGGEGGVRKVEGAVETSSVGSLEQECFRERVLVAHENGRSHDEMRDSLSLMVQIFVISISICFASRCDLVSR